MKTNAIKTSSHWLALNRGFAHSFLGGIGHGHLDTTIICKCWGVCMCVCGCVCVLCVSRV
jgi:hypothetical protein